MSFDVSRITGLTADSRKVEPGFLFVAITGVKADGRAYIADAIAKGAKFIAVAKGTECDLAVGVEKIEVESPYQFLAETAAAFYKNQPPFIAAVTGTNGKTSTVNFARMIWAGLGKKAASLGTLGLIGEGIETYTGMTTPDHVGLFAMLNEVAEKGFTHLAMEASSHGLHQHRLDGVKVRAAGFTNLTRDHLDYHGTMDSYFRAKLRLFTEVLELGSTAVINADIPECAEIVKQTKARGCNVMLYGFSESADIRILERTPVTGGQNLKLSVFDKTYSVHLNLVGVFQAMNVLCAAGMVLSDRTISSDEVIPLLETLPGVVGRLQTVPHSLNDIGVYVDYAHTPDGLETILAALRPHTKNRLICVFGCGGDRDRGKRPVMGEISTRLADVTIVTDDNPRTEDPAFIRSEIMVGAKGAIEIAGGRREAIREAVKLLKAGDVLVLAGKGHEQGQIFADHTEPFDDLKEAQAAIQDIFL